MNKIISVERVSIREIVVKLVTPVNPYDIISVYATRAYIGSGRGTSETDTCHLKDVKR